MKDIMGVIYTGEQDERLRELTAQRAIAALPLAGRYRIIDFLVSNLVGSGARNVGVIMQKNYHSLMDHLGSGKEWDLHGKRTGLVILPPFLTRENVGVYGGFLDALRSNMSYLRRSKEKYVVFADSHMVFSERLDDMVQFHIDRGADITMLYTNDPGVQRREAGRYLRVDETGRVTDIELEPTRPTYPSTYLDTTVLERQLLIDLVDRAVARSQYHFTRDVLQGLLREGTTRIMGYECKNKVWNIDSVQAYFRCNLDLLQPENRANLFRDDRPVWTKVRDEMPARYMPGAQVKNVMVADGCIIEGTVENSVLFRGVRIEKGAQVKNSVIMQDGRVCAGAQIENCILDKQTRIKPGTRLIGPENYPIVIAKQVEV